MVTTRRSTETANSYDDATAKGGVGLLERPITTQEKVSTQVVEENYTEASERMQRNLHRLLNYDRYSAEQMETVKEEVVSEKALSDPTSVRFPTTLKVIVSPVPSVTSPGTAVSAAVHSPPILCVQ